MKKNRSKRTAPEGSRAFRRKVANLHHQNRVWKALQEVIDKKFADRPKYLSDFISLWECAAVNLNQFAEDALAHRFLILPPNTAEVLLSPYDMFHLIYFSRLMDHLSFDEEERFADTCRKLDAAWQKFFTMSLAYHPDLRELVDRMAENRSELQQEVVELFTGEAPPAFTPLWGRTLDALTNDFKLLTEGLQK